MTAKELEKLHISRLRNMVRDDPKVSPIAKANRTYLSKDQLILNLTGDPEVRERVKAAMPKDTLQELRERERGDA